MIRTLMKIMLNTQNDTIIMNMEKRFPVNADALFPPSGMVIGEELSSSMVTSYYRYYMQMIPDIHP